MSYTNYTISSEESRDREEKTENSVMETSKVQEQERIENPVVETSKVQEQEKTENPVVETSKVEEQEKTENPVVETSKVQEQEKTENPVVETSKVQEQETSKVQEQERTENPVVETSKVQEQETSKVQEQERTENPVVETAKGQEHEKTENPVVETSKVQEQEKTIDSVEVTTIPKKKLSGSMRRKLIRARKLGIILNPETIAEFRGISLFEILSKEGIKQLQPVGGISHNKGNIKQPKPVGGELSHNKDTIKQPQQIGGGIAHNKEAIKQSQPIGGGILHNKETIKQSQPVEGEFSHNIESIKQPQPIGRGISQLVAERRRVAIVPDNYPQVVLTPEQSDEITGYIMYRINTLDPDGDVHPRFDSMSKQSGGCVIKCLDDTTRVWVEEEVRGLELTCGIKLKTISVSSLRKTVKAGALFPGRIRSNTELLMILKIQNPDINFKRWKIRVKKEEEGGIFIIFELPQAVSKTLGSGGRLICYGLRQVNLRLFEKDDYRLPPPGYHFGCPRNIVKRGLKIDGV